MVTALYIFLAISLFHFIYQTFLLPTLRLELRFKLFTLRDKLRRIKLEKGAELDDKVMYDLEKMININIKSLPFFDFAALYQTNKYFEKNPKANSKVETRKKYLDESSLQEVKDIYKENVRLFLLTIAINSGGWIIYIVPAIFIAFIYESIKNVIKKMVFLPENDFEKIVAHKTI